MILDGHNALIISSTAGGKTEAVFAPLIERLIQEGWKGMGFSQITLSNPSDSTVFQEVYNFFADLDVPVLQATTVVKSRDSWKKDTVGMGPIEISTSVIWPEFDGQIITVPGSFLERDKDGNYRNTFVQDRVDRIASLAIAWAVLRRTPVAERKVVFMMMDTGEELLAYLRNDSMWSTISAVKTDNAYVLTGQASNLLNRPVPRLVDGVEILADMLYPNAMGVTLPKVLDSNYTKYLNSTASVSDSNVPKTVTDGLGRSVTLSSQPTRIVSTSDVPTQMLYALGMGSKIVGVSSDGRYNNSDNVIGVGNLGNYPSDVRSRLNDGTLTSVGGTCPSMRRTTSSRASTISTAARKGWLG